MVKQVTPVGSRTRATGGWHPTLSGGDQWREAVAEGGPERLLWVDAASNRGVYLAQEPLPYGQDRGIIVLVAPEAGSQTGAEEFDSLVQGRHRPREAVEGVRRGFQRVGPVRPLLGLDGVPSGNDIVGGFGPDLAEDVRMPTEELPTDGLEDIFQGEVARLLGDLGVEHRL